MEKIKRKEKMKPKKKGNQNQNQKITSLKALTSAPCSRRHRVISIWFKNDETISGVDST